MRSGLTTAHFSMIERGKRQPSMQSIQKIADALQVDKEVFWWNSVTRPMSKDANYSLVHTRERVVYSGRYNDNMYFKSTAMILTLITVGKLLEALSRGRTTTASKIGRASCRERV